MKGKNLLILLILAALLVAGAVMTRKRTPYAPPSAIGTLLLPSLKVNDIEKVTIRSKVSTATLTKIKGQWVSADIFNYPVDYKRLHGALTDMNELKISSVIPVTPQQLSALRLTAPIKTSGTSESGTSESGTSESGTIVDFYLKNNSTPISLLIGKTHENEPTGEQQHRGYSDGRYVSPDNGTSAYIVSKTLDNLTEAQPKQWIQKDLTKVSASNLKEIKITGSNRQPISITLSKKDDKLALNGVKEDEEVDSSNLGKITSILSYLQMSNLADPTISDEKAGFPDAITFKATTKEDLEYTVLIGGKKDASLDRYIRISVASVSTETLEESTTENAAKKAEQAQKIQEEITYLNKKFTGWTYIISSSNADSFTMERETLTKKKNKEKEEEKDK